MIEATGQKGILSKGGVGERVSLVSWEVGGQGVGRQTLQAPKQAQGGMGSTFMCSQGFY